MGMRPSARRYSCARTTAAVLVRAAGTTSTSGISSGGFSACATRQRSWRRQRAKISAGGRPLEELVSSVSGPVTCSIEPNSFCFAIASSGIASITQSASWTAWSRLRACVNSSKPRSTMPWVARSSATRAPVRPLLQINYQPLLLEAEGRGLEERRDRQHVVHDAAVQPLLLLVELDVEAERIVDPARLRRPGVLQSRRLVLGEHHLAGDVEAHHLGRQLGAEHDVQRLGVAPGVELGIPGRVPPGADIADHRDVPRDLGPYQLRIAAQREREARYRAERDQRDGIRLLGEQAIERFHEVEDHA